MEDTAFMYGFFRRKKRQAIANTAVREIYGSNPPANRVDLESAITLAHQNLLLERIPREDVARLTTSLFNGPMPLSTHDLAASAALAFFQAPNYIERLRGCQLSARACILDWLKAGNIAPKIAIAFEVMLYREYKAEPLT